MSTDLPCWPNRQQTRSVSTCDAWL